MNGQETGVDCGGPDCIPCYCTDNRLQLNDYTTDDNFVRSANEWILLNEDVMLRSNSNIIFKAAECINIDKNFEIELGSETLLTIEDCIEPDPYPFSNASLLSRDNCGTQFEPMSLGTDICDPNRPDLNLRLNLFIMRNDGGSGGLSQASYNSMINQLRFTFDPQRIFFEICLTEISNSTILSEGPTSSNMNYLVSNFAKSDALNGFLFPLGMGNIVGRALGIPSKYFWSSNNDFTLPHEIGHCLGLYHTHMGYFSLATNSENCLTDICEQERITRPDECNGACPPFDCNNASCGPNCNETGDYVCDTPPDLRDCQDFTLTDGILNYPAWSDDCGKTYQSNNTIPSNVMSYWFNGRFLTEGQACRVYTTSLEFHKDAIIDNNPVVVVNGTFTVTQNTVLTNDYIFNGDIVVEAGVSLNLNGIRAEFSSNSRIITNSIAVGNGYLTSSIIIQNSLLVPTCGEHSWGGFDLEEGTQFEVQNSSIIDANVIDASFNINEVNENIPSLYSIHNSTIENSPLFLNHIDGLVDLTDTKFLRNKPSLYPLVLIDGDDMSNALIRDCTFINNEISTDSNADGLIITDIGFASVGNSFKNFDRAMRLGTILKAPNGASVRECTFTNNYIGIDASAFTGLNIRDNVFDIGQAWEDVTQDHSGIYLNFCSDYQVEENRFRRGSIGVDRKGLIIQDGGSDFESVRSNSFDGLNEAILALGENRDVTNNGIVGLEFSCNNMGFGSILDTDILVADDGVQRQQGDPVDGAGNNFSYGNFSDSESSIRMSTTTDMDYYRAANQFSNNPDFIDPLKIEVLTADQVPQCFDLNFRLVQIKNSNKQELETLIDSYLYYKAEIGRTEFTTDELTILLREINIEIKSMINNSDYILSEAEVNAYWTEYKTSLIAKRKAIIDGLKTEVNQLNPVIEDINQLSAERYTQSFDYQSFVDILHTRISSSEKFIAELYRNLLLSIELQMI